MRNGAAPGVGADGAGGGVGEVLATVAEDDIVFYGIDRVRQGEGLFLGKANDVVGEPLGAFGADAWKLVQLLDQAGKGRRG